MQIHFDVALFFKFCACEFQSNIAPLSIEKFIELVQDCDTINDFEDKFNAFVQSLLTRTTKQYLENINSLPSK